jgi:hypothetical protein
MARAQGDPGRYLTKQFGASASVSTEDIKGFGRLLITTAGIVLKMPEPNADLGDMNWEGVAVNPTAGDACLTLNGTFNGGRSTVVVPAGGQVRFMYGLAETGYQCDVEGAIAGVGAVAQSYTSTLAWTTATPDLAAAAVATASMAYQLEQGVCWFETSIAWDDGNGATNITATIPLDAPCMSSCDIPIMGYITVDGTETEILAYIDGGQAALADRIIKCRTAFTATNAKAGSIVFRGWYPVYGFTSYGATATKTWGTEDPEAQTTVMLYKLLEGVGGSLSCIGVFQTLAADGNGSTSLTVSLPIEPIDQNFYVEAIGRQKVNATWYNPYALIDESTATAASRLLAFEDFETHVNAQAHQESVSFFYEVSGWTAYTATPDWAGGTADPASVPTKKGRYTIIGSQCVGAAYITCTDGNGVTNVEVPLGVPPRYSAYPIPIVCMELSDAAMSEPRAYIDATQTDPTDRLIKMTNFTAIANATNGAVTLSYHYRLN